MSTVISSILSALMFIQFSIWREADPCVDQMKFDINGIRLHVDVYECSGKDSPADEDSRTVDTILLLHGGGASLDTYYKNIPTLAKHFRVIAPDTRAHGRSTDDPGQALSYDLLAADMVALLDELNLDKVHVVGWSDGGIIAKTIAMQYPERVEQLVLIASIYSQDGYRPEARERLLNATADDWEPDAIGPE